MKYVLRNTANTCHGYSASSSNNERSVGSSSSNDKQRAVVNIVHITLFLDISINTSQHFDGRFHGAWYCWASYWQSDKM